MTWQYTMTTPYWSDFVPNLTFHRILRGFHRTFATGVACRQGTLTPPDTLGLAYVLLVEANPFSELVGFFFELYSSNIPLYFLDFAWICCTLPSTRRVLGEKRKRSGSVLWQNLKHLHPQKIKKKQCDNTKAPPKTSITQRLRTDLGR